MKLPMPTQAQRAYLYRVLVAVGLVLVAKGVITESDFQAYEAVAVAALGLAALNTPTKPDAPE